MLNQANPEHMKVEAGGDTSFHIGRISTKGKECWLRRKPTFEEETENDKMMVSDIFDSSGFQSQVSTNSNVSGEIFSINSENSLPEWSNEAFSRQCTEIDAMATKVAAEIKVKEALQAAVGECNLCVTIADPRNPDLPLIAVSDGFEKITGYERSEIVNKSCRMLQVGCQQTEVDHMRLRAACATGEHFTGVFENRRKSGELFLNLLDLRGLTLARNPQTGEELWFLIAIQADISHRSDSSNIAVSEHLEALREIASGIRANLVKELSAFALSGALMTSFEGTQELSSSCQDAWCILAHPIWKPCSQNVTFIGSNHDKSGGSAEPLSRVVTRLEGLPAMRDSAGSPVCVQHRSYHNKSGGSAEPLSLVPIGACGIVAALTATLLLKLWKE